MFKSSSKAKQALASLDWSQVIASEPDVTAPSVLAELGINGDVQCLAWDAVQGLLAVATKTANVYLVGKAGVYTSWQLQRSATGVKHLAFKSGSPLLCVVDGRDTVHVFDLSDLDAEQKPHRLLAWSARSTVTCIETSPAHSHLILGLRDGTVDFYDLDRAHASPYRIPNLWLAQEELLRRSGVYQAPSRRHIPTCMAIAQHPLDLNRLFIGYEGGCILYNLRDRQPEHVYELVIPPGAAGGGNDPEDAQLTERRPALTCIAVRPDGLVLAAGSEDGCICFWSIENGDIPLLVRTIDREHVNRIDADAMFGSAGQTDEFGRPVMREPIFRLSWSGFPSEGVFNMVASYAQQTPAHDANEHVNGTMLSILGGLLPSDIRGIHVLHFPAADAGGQGEDAEEIISRSLRHIGHSVYDTPLPPEDFILLTRSPHFCGAYDPFALVTVQSPYSAGGSSSNKRSLHAWSFPPSLSAVPEAATLPSSLHGAVSPLQHEVFCTSSLNLQRLWYASEQHMPRRLEIRGGYATGRTGRGGNKVDRGKKADVRLGLTLLPGLRVQLADISTQILAGTADASLVDDFPLPLFDFDIARLLLDRHCDGLMAHRLLKETPELVSISSVAFTAETSELAIALSTGEVVVGRIESTRALPVPHDHETPQGTEAPGVFSAQVVSSRVESPPLASLGQDKPASRSFSMFRSGTKGRKRSETETSQRSVPTRHLQLVDLEGAAADGLSLLVGVTGMTGVPTCMRACDIGFVAIAWPDRLLVVDLRGPDVVIDEALDRAVLGDIRTISWTVSPLDHEIDLAPRLITSHESGTTRIFTFRHSLDTWVSAGPPLSFVHASLRSPLLSRMLSPRGEPITANADALQDSLRGWHPYTAPAGLTAAFLLLVSARSAAIVGPYSEGRLAKAEFDQPMIAAEVVRRHESSALAVISANGTMQVFSLPQLELLQVVHPLINFEVAASLTARIAPDGDVILQDRNGTGALHFMSLFGRNRAVSPPQLSLHDASLRAPARPTTSILASLQGGMAGFASWMRGPAVLTGDSFDALIAGPERPPKKEPVVKARPVRAPSASAVKQPSQQPNTYESWQDSANQTYESWSKWASDLTQTKQQSSSAHRTAAETNEMLMEREDHLGRLQEGMSNLGRGASDLFKNAKNSAADAAIKNKLTRLIG